MGDEGGQTEIENMLGVPTAVLANFHQVAVFKNITENHQAVSYRCYEIECQTRLFKLWPTFAFPVNFFVVLGKIQELKFYHFQ